MNHRELPTCVGSCTFMLEIVQEKGICLLNIN